MIIDGTKIAKGIEMRITEALRHTRRRPGLAFVLVGENPASKTYIRMKQKKCEEVGILSIDREFKESLSEEALLNEIDLLNANPEVDGILVQLPLPAHISTTRVMERITPFKDVDGFHPLNIGKMFLGELDGFLPCTPHGIHILLKHAEVPLQGKHVVILGRSNIVGKPLAAILMQKNRDCNATVTVANSFTENLPALCRSADILVAAIGSPQFVRKEMVKKGAVVIDVGINRIQSADGKFRIVGDVAFDEVAPLCSQITPVPGGVGPMTIAMLLANTLLSYQR
ncbi:MAG: bifunctional methylenetetrahydrofolate dehydrogenase/methenyltetrahydrofolate cyclohydrolase FolD [Chlamydiales bacterium]|nr:bifunctional methylenetetrahydrofolate dehydrogenase/methenyltetrahydrofolate cyclohydrolase FolD [Chlamydiales bacterium]